MKRIAGIFLAALLALTVLPHGAELVTSSEVTKGIVTTAYAEENTDTINSDVTWSEQTISDDKTIVVADGVTVTITGAVKITGNVTLSGGGTFKRGSEYGQGMIEVRGGTLTIDGVTIDGAGSNVTRCAIGVYSESGTQGVLNLKSGTIRNNRISGVLSDGGGVWVASTSTFNMTGGTITENGAANGGGVCSYGTFNMSGGAITDNTATLPSGTTYGGGVYIGNGTFRMQIGENGTAPVISGNTVESTYAGSSIYYGSARGGGVYVRSGGTLIMTGGMISANKAVSTVENGIGGGVCACGIFEMQSVNGSNPTISNNSANSGGGVYVTGTSTGDKGGTVTISGGTISGNAATTGFGGGVYLARGTFNLTGGTIGGDEAGDANTVSGAAVGGGGVYVSDNQIINVSGNPVIKGNKNKNGASDNNVWLYSTTNGTNLARIKVVGNLTTGAYIEINYPEGVTNQITKENNAQYTLAENNWENVLTAGSGGESGGEQPTTYTVTIVPGEHIKTNGQLTQEVTLGHMMNSMFFYPADGYYFPKEYTASQNGVTASYMNPAQIMVTGTPTDNVTLTLPEPGKRLAGTVRIVGTAQVGQTLTAVLENGDVDQSALAYQWEYSDGVLANRINGATSSTYTLTAQDEGKSIFVQVSKAGEPGGAIYSATVGPIKASSGGEEKPETTPRYYYNSTAAADTKADGSKTGSPKTFDAGVGIYAVSAVLSLTGMAYVGKKKF